MQIKEISLSDKLWFDKKKKEKQLLRSRSFSVYRTQKNEEGLDFSLNPRPNERGVNSTHQAQRSVRKF